ncbi:hypothetical protein [Effusibacillus lacus]|uniref:Uncharacterized protein n=1 Tax=Effusibacillus lacus TaxID=1348429 RepID=A0A292YEH0_9BACL|nr:hypothetical protein [Effusibacillus lacus]TCS74898.1 hypothetical protein EDD64_11022 [Effusibacillus lacus]GAX91572.1 hypothetical protein EFBL_3262 [Effusibacillus lacus]
MVMIILLALLALIVSFGVGFILNMLTKFWMSSGIAFLALFVYIMLKVEQSLQLVDWILLLLVAFGAFASAFAIRTLKNRGFRMFQ